MELSLCLALYISIFSLTLRCSIIRFGGTYEQYEFSGHLDLCFKYIAPTYILSVDGVV